MIEFDSDQRGTAVDQKVTRNGPYGSVRTQTARHGTIDVDQKVTQTGPHGTSHPKAADPEAIAVSQKVTQTGLWS